MAETPTRRVGSWTLGVVLIALGGSLLASNFLPRFDYLTVAKLTPVVLIALGGEVLYYAAKPEKRKYDFLSIFVCLLVMGCALCVSVIPTLWRYWGPERSEAEYTIRSFLETRLYSELKDSDVESLNVTISFNGTKPAFGLGELTGAEYVSVYAWLDGPYETPEDFAAAAYAVTQAMATLDVQWDDVSVNWTASTPAGAGAPVQAALHLYGPYQIASTEAELIDHIQWETAPLGVTG